MDYIQGLAKGLAVLESFSTDRQRHSASTVAVKTGITRAAARRHLLTLAGLGYLESDGQWYWLAARVLRLSGAFLASARLPRLVQPTLDHLAAEHGQVFSTAILDEDEVVIVARSGALHLRAYGIHLGARMQAHATSTGRVLLAGLGDAELDAWIARHDLQRLTPRTLVGPGELAHSIQLVRGQDFCVALEQHELGIGAAAVPVRDPGGTVRAALNVVMPARSFSAEPEVARIIASMQKAVRELRFIL